MLNYNVNWFYVIILRVNAKAAAAKAKRSAIIKTFISLVILIVTTKSIHNFLAVDEKLHSIYTKSSINFYLLIFRTHFVKDEKYCLMR